MNYIYLETYKVETGLFPEITAEDDDNSISVPYPEKIVWDWYAKENPGMFIDACKYAEDPCQEWIENHYMISDINELYQYAKNHGCTFEKHQNTDGWTWITVSYTEEEKKPMTLEEKKTALIKFKENIYTLIAEVIFDITEAVQNTAFRQSEEDSRNIWPIINDWAWEFEYAYTYDPAYEEYEDSYYDALDYFLDPKLEEYEKHEYTVCFSKLGCYTVRAKDEYEARKLAFDNPEGIKWMDDAPVDMWTQTVKED